MRSVFIISPEGILTAESMGIKNRSVAETWPDFLDSKSGEGQFSEQRQSARPANSELGTLRRVS